MRLRKGKVYVLLVALLLIVAVVPVQQVNAGAIETMVDVSAYDRNWQNPEGDVAVEEGTLVFTNDSTEDTRVISKTAAKREDYFKTMITAEASLKFTQLPAGKSFIMAFGLSGIEAFSEEAGNVEISFTRDGSIKMGVTAFDEDGNAVEIMQPKACGISLKQAAKIRAEISTEGKITVSVGGRQICSANLPVSGEGRFGFLQTGECGVEVSDLKVKYYQYVRPENPDVYEDFEKGVLDVSSFFAKMIQSGLSPTGQYVSEYEGNQVLKFENVKQAYLGSRYTYSNFEMTFDVLHVEDTKKNSDDKPRATDSAFIISFGGEIMESPYNGFRDAADAVVFQAEKVYTTAMTAAGNKPLPLPIDPFTEYGRDCSVKVRVIDGEITASIKWLEDKNYQTVLTYDVGERNYTGYVQLWLFTPSSLIVDNISIKNMDYKPNLIETEFQSGLITAEDAVYEPLERVYAVDNNEKTKEMPWHLITPVAAVVVGGTAIAICSVTVHIREKRKRRAMRGENKM